MSFVWISEQTAIISLYNVNWLVCITETESVYCAGRTESSTIIQERSPRRKTGFDPWPIRLRFVMGNVALGNVFRRLRHLSAVSFIPPMVRTRLHLCVILIRRADGQSLEGFKKQCCFGNPDGLDKKVLFAETYQLDVARWPSCKLHNCKILQYRAQGRWLGNCVILLGGV
jgi:hypothetical protein